MLRTIPSCRSTSTSQALVKPYVSGWADNVMNVQYSKDLALAGGG